MTREMVVVTKSTVPVGSAAKVAAEVAKEAKFAFHICSNPEFLKEGDAVEDFMRPDRVVLGVESAHARRVMMDIYAPFVRTGKPILVMDISSAEMTKYAANGMLATRISFMNEIANLCDKLGANVDFVRKGIGSDSRIGQSFLFPGPGFGGSSSIALQSVDGRSGFIYVTGGGETMSGNPGTCWVARLPGDGTITAFQETSPLDAGPKYHSSVAAPGHVYVAGGSWWSGGSFTGMGSDLPFVSVADVGAGGKLGPWRRTAMLTRASSGWRLATLGGRLYALAAADKSLALGKQFGVEDREQCCRGVLLHLEVGQGHGHKRSRREHL